jgi:hypothetical protein
MFTLSVHSELAVIARTQILDSPLPFPGLSEPFTRDMFPFSFIRLSSTSNLIIPRGINHSLPDNYWSHCRTYSIYISRDAILERIASRLLLPLSLCARFFSRAKVHHLRSVLPPPSPTSAAAFHRLPPPLKQLTPHCFTTHQLHSLKLLSSAKFRISSAF